MTKKGINNILTLFSIGCVIGAGAQAGSKMVDFVVKEYEASLDKLLNKIFKIES